VVYSLKKIVLFVVLAFLLVQAAPVSAANCEYRVGPTNRTPPTFSDGFSDWEDGKFHTMLDDCAGVDAGDGFLVFDGDDERVSLDCDGHILFVDGAVANAIKIKDGAENITLTNCTIQSTFTVLEASDSENITIRDSLLLGSNRSDKHTNGIIASNITGFEITGTEIEGASPFIGENISDFDLIDSVIKVSGVQFAADGALLLVDLTDALIKNNTIYSLVDDALVGVGMFDLENVIFENNNIFAFALLGMRINGAPNGLVLRNNTVHDIGVPADAINGGASGDGIFILRSNDVEVYETTAENVHSKALIFENIANLLVEGVKIDNSNIGIELENTRTTTIRGKPGDFDFGTNTFENIGETGILLNGNVNFTLLNTEFIAPRNQRLLGTGPTGIAILDSSVVHIGQENAGNTFTNMDTAIKIEVDNTSENTSQITISNNNIHNSGFANIELEYVEVANLTSNQINNSAIGLRSLGSKRVSLNGGNVLQGNSDEAVFMSSHPLLSQAGQPAPVPTCDLMQFSNPRDPANPNAFLREPNLIQFNTGGVRISTCPSTTILNTVFKNNGKGVRVSNVSNLFIADSQFSDIRVQTINGTTPALHLTDVTEFQLVGNEFSNNFDALKLENITDLDGAVSKIYNNRFIVNGDDLEAVNSPNLLLSLPAINCAIENALGGPCLGGNYWEKYVDAADLTGDGIADEAYSPFPGLPDIIDNFPLSIPIECIVTADCHGDPAEGCLNGKAVCQNSTCVYTPFCEPGTGLCNPDTGVCQLPQIPFIPCIVDTDCAGDSLACTSARCVPDPTNPVQKTCVQEALVCDEGFACTEPSGCELEATQPVAVDETHPLLVLMMLLAVIFIVNRSQRRKP
jgi:hypothetical protein